MQKTSNSLYYLAVLVCIIALCRCSDQKRNNNDDHDSDLFWNMLKEGEESEKCQQYVAAEKCYVNAIEGIKKAGMKTAGTYEALANVYFIQGRYESCIKMRQLALESGEDDPWKRDLNYMWMGDAYLEQGYYDLALRTYQAGQEDARAVAILDPNYGHVASGFDASFGLYCVYIGSYAEARKYLKKKLDSCIERKIPAGAIATAQDDLAMALFYSGDYTEAEKIYAKSEKIYVNSAVAFHEKISNNLIMLGRVAEHQGENEKALRYFQKAYDILPMYQTVIHKIEQADVLNQIGRFQLRQGKPEESAKAYRDAIQLRRETGTATHPNYADPLKGLADVATYRNDLTSASLLATQSLAVLDNSVLPTHPRTASALIALTAIRAMSGEGAAASGNTPTSPSLSTASLNARLDTILQKPLGPWKEDFVDTASFYAQLLKKSGKQAEAARLEQIAAERKEKN